MKKMFWLIAFSLISCLNLSAQDEFDKDPYFEPEKDMVNLFSNAVGARYSDISGFGLSYSRTIEKMYTIKITGLMHFDEYVKWENMTKTTTIEDTKDILYDIGIEFQVDLFTTSRSKIFAFIGGYTSNQTKKDATLNYTNQDKAETKIVAGLGCGVLFHFGPNVAAEANVGYKYDQANIEENQQPSERIQTNVGYSVGLMFLF